MARVFKTGITADGDVITGGKLQSTASSGDEGGEIFLNKAVTNTTINGGVTIDVYQNKLRFFEQGGTARGFYIDMTTGGAGVGTNLVSGGGGSGTVTSIATTSPITGGTITSTGTIGIDQTLMYVGSAYSLAADYVLDFSGGVTPQSLLDSTTKGITLSAGTYEFEFFGLAGMAFISSTTMAPAFGVTYSTVSGSPTVTGHYMSTYGTGTSSGSAVTQTAIRNSLTQKSATLTAISTGSRFITLSMKGIVRVTSGSIKFYPSCVSTVAGDNPVTIYANATFKIKPLGTSSTSTGPGTFA